MATTVVFFLFYLSLFITSLFLTKLLFLSKRSSCRNGSSLPPSPPSLPFLGHLHLVKKPLHRALARLSARHGPLLLLRFGSRRVLLVSSHSLAEECFTRNDLAFASRPQLPSSRLLTYSHTTLAAAPYGPHWRNVRRLAAVELLSSARLHSLCEVRLGELRSLVSSLFREYDRHSCAHGSEPLKRLELKSRLFGLALNVIMRMIAGKRYYVEEDSKDSEEARRFREFVEEILTAVGVSNPSDFLPGLSWMDFRGTNERIERLAAAREEILQGLIEDRRRSGGGGGGGREEEEERKKKKTMIEVMLSLQKEDPDYYTDNFIKAQMQTLLVAGSDTTTETIEWAMSRMANHPGALRKARSEIDACVGSSRLLEEHDLPSLPYLHAIICETFRLHPTAPLLVPHESQEDCTVGGYRVPRGTILLVNAWAIQRDPAAWEEPLEFRPERFVDANRGEVGARLIPFGMGRRKCPGEGLATRVVGLVLGTMIQCFEWERVGEEEVDMAERAAGVTLPKATALELMYRPRQAMVGVLSQL
ncbi:isoflavone 3'-hydroxylase-like [Iris pallida]|uniref:Isoflavone 3'-hydroxylase-like n=1 Tax=Iris pallida TaxID=29817 RepID=A0AAX6FV94_IRIPA|nr:isoflavone 3'-hydroxylase-like [Iris pallida]